MIEIITEYSIGWYPLFLLFGFGISFLLYKKKDVPWSKQMNKFLFGVRVFIWSILFLLLLGPLLKRIIKKMEKPIVVMTLDRSTSMTRELDSTRITAFNDEVQEFGDQLEDAGYEVELLTQGSLVSPLNDLDKVNFDITETNLSSLLIQVKTLFENRNLTDVVLISDGIFNKGFSPLNIPFSTPIHTIGMGDTIPHEDLYLKAVYANKIAYQGNMFPVIVEFASYGLMDKETEIELWDRSKKIDSQKIKIKGQNDYQQLRFLVKANQKGLQRYTIKVKPIVGELTLKNNQKNVYIDVLEGKDKILLVADSPHPDIKAIKAAVEYNKTFEVDIYIPKLKESFDLASKSGDAYDLIIFHQIPNSRGTGLNLINSFKKKGKSIWYIIGPQSNINLVSKVNILMNLTQVGFQSDKVTAFLHDKFNFFSYQAELKDIISKLPPVSVPFGNFSLKANSQILLYQQVGNVKTNKPMMVLGEVEGRKEAITITDGLWLWRLQEPLFNQDQAAVDELIRKTVQYLATKEDKRKFRVYPVSSENIEGEDVQFITEVYNNIYEEVYGDKITLEIRSDKSGQTFSYVNSGPNFKFNIKGLTEGIYRYTATLNKKGYQEKVNGEFLIEKVDLEAIKTTADFNLLRSLSQKTGGKFAKMNSMEELSEHFNQKEIINRIHAEERFDDMGSIWWALLIVSLLATLEWFLRKYYGGY